MSNWNNVLQTCLRSSPLLHQIILINYYSNLAHCIIYNCARLTTVIKYWPCIDTFLYVCNPVQIVTVTFFMVYLLLCLLKLSNSLVLLYKSLQLKIFIICVQICTCDTDMEHFKNLKNFCVRIDYVRWNVFFNDSVLSVYNFWDILTRIM